jgi:hypothetical protein
VIRALHDPNDVLPYTLDWGDWLAGFPTTTTIAAVTVTGPDGITISDSDHTDTTTTAVITGGEVGTEYPILFRITLSAGPPYSADQTLTLVVRQR